MKLSDELSPVEKHELTKAMLRVRGTSMAQLARQLGVSNSSISLVSLGKHRSARIELAIADALGMQPKSIWPERFKKGEHE